MGKGTDEVRTAGAGDNPERSDPDQAAYIRAGIENTRAEMGETIDALQERLTPDRLKESAKQAVKRATVRKAEQVMNKVSETVGDVTHKASGAAREAASSVTGTIREDPVPFALIAAGIGLLAYSKWARTPDHRHYREYRGYDAPYEGEPDYVTETHTESAGEPSVMDRVRETAGDVASRAQATTREIGGSMRRAADRTREQVEQVSQQVQQRAQRTADDISHTFMSNPLAVGAAVLAGGAAIGLALPTTRVEREYMGEARDQFMDRAESTAKDTAAKIKRIAEEAGRTAKQEAQDQGLMT